MHSFNMDERMLSLAFLQHSNVVATTSTPQVHRLGAPTTSLTPEDTAITSSPKSTTTPESLLPPRQRLRLRRSLLLPCHCLTLCQRQSTTEATQEPTTTTSATETTTTSTPEVATTTSTTITTEATTFWLNVKLPRSKSVIPPGCGICFSS
jgi:hypothetical protein